MEKLRRGVCTVAAAATAMLSLGEATHGGGMSPNYYKTTCPHLEDIVLEEVTRKKNETVVTIPAVLRLFFHDCLVNGCDASVLIASRHDDAEKNSPDNDSLAGDGYDTVNRAKAGVERKCPGVVSCADILALATRDVVHLASGPYWTVELGRLDGLVSKASDVEDKLPGEDMHVKELTDIFHDNGMSQRDMVALSGAHTVGFAHCTRFTKRLYNYSSTVQLDPSFNPEYARRLTEEKPTNSPFLPSRSRAHLAAVAPVLIWGKPNPSHPRAHLAAGGGGDGCGAQPSKEAGVVGAPRRPSLARGRDVKQAARRDSFGSAAARSPPPRRPPHARTTPPRRPPPHARNLRTCPLLGLYFGKHPRDEPARRRVGFGRWCRFRDNLWNLSPIKTDAFLICALCGTVRAPTDPQGGEGSSQP